MPLSIPQIESVQPDLVAKLNSESYFIDIPVFGIREARMRSDVDKALAGAKPKNGKAGITVQVMMPALVKPQPNTPGPLCSIRVLIRVQENPAINLGAHGTGKTAEAVGVMVLQLIHGFSLPGIASTFFAEPGEAMVSNQSFAPLVTYDITMESLFPMAMLPKLATPNIVCPEFSLSITHQDATATLYYTTNSSFPGPGNAAAKAYNAPISVTVGQIIRAAAYKTGYAGSDAAMSEITQ